MVGKYINPLMKSNMKQSMQSPGRWRARHGPNKAAGNDSREVEGSCKDSMATGEENRGV